MSHLTLRSRFNLLLMGLYWLLSSHRGCRPSLRHLCSGENGPSRLLFLSQIITYINRKAFLKKKRGKCLKKQNKSSL